MLNIPWDRERGLVFHGKVYTSRSWGPDESEGSFPAWGVLVRSNMEEDALEHQIPYQKSLVLHMSFVVYPRAYLYLKFFMLGSIDVS